MKFRQFLAFAAAIQLGAFLGSTPLIGLGAEKYKVTILHPLNGLTASHATGNSLTTQVGRVLGNATGGVDHAVVWNGTAESLVDLHPPGFDSSSADGVSDESQVGYGLIGNFEYHALLWKGTAESVIDLQPDGYDASVATGVFGNQQVGWGYTKLLRTHALLWNGTAEGAVILNPPGYWMSFAKGVSEGTQVGSALVSELFGEHAVLWRGTAESYVDLHPDGFYHSGALGVSGDSQVGWATSFADDYYAHAMLWKGSATDFVDLHPAEFDATSAVATSGDLQVGYGNVYAEHNSFLYSHALLWNGSADSVVDLHKSFNGLPYSFTTSYATGVNSDGEIVGVAGDELSIRYAVLWTPIPEPATSALLLFAGLVIQASRRRHRW